MVLNIQIYKLDTKIFNESFEEVFNNLDLAAKINIALGFVFRKIETDEYRYFYDQKTTLPLKNAFRCVLKQT